jgi:alpha-glucosidase
MIVSKRANYIAKTNGTRNFPWRVLLIAREDKELPTNDLVYRLASPTTIEDASWIHPGKCTDEWIIDINLFNVPFKSGINTASYKYYIDFAKHFGFDRIMMDAGWSNTKDLFDINPNINMDTLAAYAKKQGIKLSMWTLSMTLNKQLDSALKQFQKWGVDFIMTDFIDRDDQPTVNFYKRIAEACAKAHLMIMFHGAFPPKGFNRTYPNNITREGVLGSEYNAWSDKVTASHNCIISFTRMLAGPLDYEPGLLDNATPQQFKPIWGKVMSQTTRCQQLSMFVVYDDPLPIFSGNPSQGYLEPKFMDLLGSIPAGWDTTIILDAKVGNYIVTARRKNNDWVIGGMTDSSERDITINLSFLYNRGHADSYIATICKDGINADRNATDYIIEEKTLMANDKLQIHMAPAGGVLLRLVKE